MNKEIIEKIVKGEIKMKPKAYFVIKSVLVILAFLLCSLFALFLISFVVFIMVENGSFAFPGFGFVGFKVLFGSLPWVLVILALVLIFALEVLLKKFSFTWKKPIVYSLLGVVLFVFLAGGVIAKTGLHNKLLQRANQGGLPILGGAYVGFRGNVIHCRGVVEYVEDNFFSINTNKKIPCPCQINANTKMPQDRQVIEGDRVMVLGRLRKDGPIELLVIKFLK